MMPHRETHINGALLHSATIKGDLSQKRNWADSISGQRVVKKIQAISVYFYSINSRRNDVPFHL